MLSSAEKNVFSFFLGGFLLFRFLSDAFRNDGYGGLFLRVVFGLFLLLLFLGGYKGVLPPYTEEVKLPQWFCFLCF